MKRDDGWRVRRLVAGCVLWVLSVGVAAGSIVPVGGQTACAAMAREAVYCAQTEDRSNPLGEGDDAFEALAEAPSGGSVWVPIRLVVEGREYKENACIPVLSMLRAAGWGGYENWFAHLVREGANARAILDAAAYPLGRGVEAWLATIETPSRDAVVTMGRYAPVVTPHRVGLVVDRRRLVMAVAACLDGREPEPLSLGEQTPRLTTEAARRGSVRIAEFATPYAAKPNRVHNLRLACRAMHGVCVAPGATFSFNQTVGPRDEAHGYLPAKVIMDGEYVEGMGGGVCQVSTTVYNAAMLAGMTQVEAHPHSRAVHYTAPSRDAMVSGWSDMRFANPTPYPVYLAAWAENGMVRVRVYGAAPRSSAVLDARSVVCEGHLDVDEQGNVLTDTEGYTLLAEGQDGVRATLWRQMDGRRECLRRDLYPARNAVWRKEK